MEGQSAISLNTLPKKQKPSPTGLEKITPLPPSAPALFAYFIYQPRQPPYFCQKWRHKVALLLRCRKRNQHRHSKALEIMTYTQVSSEQSQPLFLRVNNRNAASKALNAIRAENYAERTQQIQAQAQIKSTPQTTSTDATAKSQPDDFGFEDLLDMVNPLQHIPVVSTLYQDITGDTMSAPAKIVGGGIFGGVTGLASSVVDAIVEEISGLDVGQHVLAFFSDEDAGDTDKTPAPNQVDTQLANLPTKKAQDEHNKSAKTQMPENTGGIQLASYTVHQAPSTTASKTNTAQPELPDMQERIKDPKAAWSNRPNLSPTAFNALLASFEETSKTTQSIAQQVATKDVANSTGTKTRGAAEIIQTSTIAQSKYADAQATSRSVQ
jgi:hypothetical protein